MKVYFFAQQYIDQNSNIIEENNIILLYMSIESFTKEISRS